MSGRRKVMFRPRRLLMLLALVCLSAIGFAQGGAGGYGQGSRGGGGGFGGGGRGGGGFGAPESSDDSQDAKQRRPEQDQGPGVWESKTAILTPGDRVEFKLKMHKGETLMASADSDAFDPALSLEDAKGVAIFKNDDRADGDQSPFLIGRVPEEGTYTLKVLSYRSVSGGKFTVKMRTFSAVDVPLGPAVSNRSKVGDEFDGNRLMLRLSAKKGKAYDLYNARIVKPYNSELTLIRVIGPTGVEASDIQTIPTADRSKVFVALADGDYYLEFDSTQAMQFKTNFREVTILAAQPTDAQTFDLDAGEIKVVEFPVKPDEIVRTTVKGTNLVTGISGPPGATGSGENNAGGFGNNRVWAWFKMNVDSEDDVVRIFHGEGTARVAIRSSAPSVQRVTFKNVESLPTWDKGKPFESTIDIGDSRLFLIKSTKSELMRVAAKASHFQPRLDIFRMSGDIANTLLDRKTHAAADDLYFPDEGTFVVRLSCDGDGGSGDFSMHRDTLLAAPYALGTPQALQLDGVNFGLYDVDLQAGKRYELVTDEPGKMLRADLLDEDGQFLVSQRIRFDKVEAQYFVPTKSGHHRLWLRGEPGTRHFKFAAHVAPTIGG